VNLGNPADYFFEATAATAGDIRITNDTIDFTVYRYDKPVVDFGLNTTEYVEDIQLDIDAGFSPHYQYQWQDGFAEHLYTATASGIYRVIATDNRTQCFDGDTVTVFLIYNDIGVTAVDMPPDGCTGTYDQVKVTVRNTGTTTIGRDVPIFVACDVNGIRVTLDTLVRAGNFGTNTSLDLVLSGDVVILSGGLSNIAFYTLYGQDMKTWNDTLRMTFDALPGPVIDFGDVNGELNTELPHILDAGAGHKSYLWQNGSTGQTYTVTQNGIYSVQVTGMNDCQASKTVRINMPSGIGTVESAEGGIILYPNPSNGLFGISMTDVDSREVLVRIYNNQGQLVFNRAVQVSELENEQVDVQHLPNGMYHMVMYAKERIFRAKMIIQ
jgi:hypothetical protein